MKTASKIFAVVAAALLAGPAFGATPEGKSLHCILSNSPIPVTGFRPPSDGRIEMKVALEAIPLPSGVACFFCARSAGATVADRVSFGVFAFADKWNIHYSKTNYQIEDSSDKTGRPLILSASAKGGIVVNGVQVPNSTFDEADFVPGGDLVLLAAQEATTGVGYANNADFRFYWAKVYDGEGQLIASFVPWLGKTEKGKDVPGVLDEHTGIFYPPDNPTEVRVCEEPGHRLAWCATKAEGSYGVGLYVDTGFVPPSRGRVEMKFALTPSDLSNNGYYTPFCARANKTDKTLRQAFGVIVSVEAGVPAPSVHFHYHQDYTKCVAEEMLFFSEMTMSVSANDGIFVNGHFVEGSNVGAADFTVGGSLLIFAAPSVAGGNSYADTFANMRFYWLKVYDEEDNLVASYVPWADDFGVVGVCNELTGEFIEPTFAGSSAGASTGTLYAGRTVSAEMTGRRTAKVKVSAIPEGVGVLQSDLCLWPVCDAEDKGEILASWTYEGEPVRISGDACEVEVEFPKQYKGANRFGRVLLAAPPSLAASGAQYAELNRPLTDADGVEIVFSSANVQQQTMIFGSRSAAGSQNISILLNNGNANVDFCNDGSYSTYRQVSALMSANVYQVVVDKFRRATTNLTTGAEVSTPNTTEYKGEAISQPGNCGIFGASAGAPSGYGNFVGSIYSFRVYEVATGRTLYNLEPGKNANGVPCFIDTLTGDTYENKGKGRFILDAGTSVSTSFIMPTLKPQGLIIFLASTLQL